jgi:anti-sigma B factor antagonist
MSISAKALSDGRWLVAVSGRLEQTQTPRLESTLQELLQKGHKEIIVDLHETSYINSGGLRCLVTAWRMAREQGGDLYLCCLTPRVKDVVVMVGFDKVFRVFSSLDEAQQAWESRPS